MEKQKLQFMNESGDFEELRVEVRLMDICLITIIMFWGFYDLVWYNKPLFYYSSHSLMISVIK